MLRTMTQEDLASRLADMLSAILCLTTGGELAFHPDRKYLLPKFVDVMREYDQRSICPVPADLIARGRIPRPSHPHPPAGSEFVEGGVLPEEFLIKYGQECFLRPMLDSGIVRVMPASFYSDPSMGTAISDNELVFTSIDYGEEYGLRLYDKVTKKPGDLIPVKGPIQILNSTLGDYYVSCYSNSFDLRLFSDFNANSFILIRDRAEFAARLQWAFNKQVGRWKSCASNTIYRDPLEDPWKSKDVVRLKDFRYTYQNEYRYVWMPHDHRTKLGPLYLRLGSIADIAELHKVGYSACQLASSADQVVAVTEIIRKLVKGL